MKILIVAATEQEIEPLLKQITFTAKPNKLYISTYRHHHLTILITGVGMVATTFWLTKTLQTISYDIAINLGIAGSFDKNIPLGTVVNVINDSFPEMGAEDGSDFLTIEELNLRAKDEYPFQNGVLNAVYRTKNPVLDQLLKVSGITVNTVHGNEISIDSIKKQYNPDVESMEGAAFLYTCLMERIPCMQIRSISNYVKKRNKATWNVPLAIRNLNEVAKKLLDIIVD